MFWLGSACVKTRQFYFIGCGFMCHVKMSVRVIRAGDFVS